VGVKRGVIKKFAELSIALGCLISGVPVIKGKPGSRQIEKLKAAIVAARKSGQLSDTAKRIVVQLGLLSDCNLFGPLAGHPLPADIGFVRAARLARRFLGETMPVTWRIHTSITNDRADEVCAFLSDLGDKVQLVTGNTHLTSLPDPPGPEEGEAAGVALTTLQDATHTLSRADLVYAKREVELWQFPRLLYFSREHYDVSYWMPLIEERVPVLNRGCLFVPAGAIKFIKATLPGLDLESKKAGMFVRPDSGLKFFTGFVLDITPADSWDEIYRAIYQEAHPSDRTMVCLSLARDLEPTEWRFWIVNRKVVASSPYSWGGPVPWSEPPAGAVAVAEAMAANPWQPDLAFVVDVVQTIDDQKFWVNEINAASTSGIYNVPLGDLLPALRDIAIKEATGEVEFSEACRLSPDEWLY